MAEARTSGNGYCFLARAGGMELMLSWVRRTSSTCCRRACRCILLRELRLCLVDQTLLALIFSVDGGQFRGGGKLGLVVESVEDTST